MDFKELKIAFTTDHEKSLSTFYDSQRKNFLTWARSRFDADVDTLLDVYQDSIIVLYNRVIEGRTTEIKTSPEAYLFGVARNLLLKRTIQIKRVTKTENIFDFIPDEGETDLYDSFDKDHNKMILSQGLNKLDNSCRQILELFYYRRYKLEAIKEHLKYENTDVVKSRKYQCMKKLKKIISESNVK